MSLSPAEPTTTRPSPREPSRGESGRAGAQAGPAGASPTAPADAHTPSAARAEPLLPRGPEETPVLISGGARFRGLVSFAGRARVEGEVQGEIVGESGTLLLGPEARVEADVEVDELVVGGHLRGLVRARRRVTVTETGIVEGELQTPLLSVADGGQLRARCVTRDVAAEEPDGGGGSEGSGGPGGGPDAEPPLRL